VAGNFIAFDALFDHLFRYLIILTILLVMKVRWQHSRYWWKIFFSSFVRNLNLFISAIAELIIFESQCSTEYRFSPDVSSTIASKTG